MWNPRTLEMSTSLRADLLTETLSTQGPCSQVNDKEVAYLGKPLPNSPGVIRAFDPTYLILQALHGWKAATYLHSLGQRRGRSKRC